MEVSMVIFVLVLLLCLAVPVLLVTACMIYCLLSRQIKANDKLSVSSPATLSTIESTTAETIPNARHSDGKTSVVIEPDNSFNPDVPAIASTVFTYTRTPFGTRTTAGFDLGETSFRASWTNTNGQNHGPDSLATALEGVLALHRQLEELRHLRLEH